MREVRASLVSKITAVITGLVFLNMGFFLNEVRLLKLDVHSQLVENIVKMISTTGFEEEKDCSTEGGENGTEQVIDLHLVHQSLITSSGFLPYNKSAGNHIDQFVNTSHADILTPPPKNV